MTERLLIVEDEETLCTSLQRVLSQEGYEVDIADSAETAGGLLASKSYDLVIVDIILPGISGIELLAKHRKTHASQKMVVITAHASMETAVAAIKAGACDYITKPLMHDELKRVVRKALENPG
jgi:DNA-binding NtrC family response regulator